MVYSQNSRRALSQLNKRKGAATGRFKKMKLLFGVLALLMAACMSTPMAETQSETAGTDEDQVDPAIIAEISQLEKSITPPAGWANRQGMVNYRPMAIFFKPEAERNENGEKVFNEYVNVIRDNLLNGANNYVEKAKTAWLAQNVSYRLINERDVNLSNGAKAKLITGSFTQNSAEIKNIQLFVGRGDMMYIVSGFVLAKNWDAEEDMITAAVMSFKFLE